MVQMGTTARWQLVVESIDGLSVQLPLSPGLYRVGKEVGADFALGDLVGTLDVTSHGVRAELADLSADLTQVAATVAGIKLRVTGYAGATQRRTHSLPAIPQVGAAQPIMLSDIKNRMPPRTTATELRIGSDETNDFRPASDFLSQFHCVLFVRKKRWFIKDLGSKNGTFLNETRVSEAELQVPSVLRVGDITWRVEHIDDTPLARHASQLLGRSPAMRELHAKITKFAPTKGSVLIVGESGTGKELVARAIHDGSSRHAKPFVTLNCGAFAASLIESELFGHVRGSFTGATDKRNGAFLSADQGTLFLDEIGELPLELQPKLLRVLESQQIKAVGDDRPRSVNVRVVAATHRDLRTAIREGKFREDLYHRISVLTIDVPPLRQRMGDLDLLTDCFLSEMAGENEIIQLSQDAKEALAAHRFTGNVRELRNALVRGTLSRHGSVITAVDLALPDEPLTAPPAQLASSSLPSTVTMEGAERHAIVAALTTCKGSRVRAAKMLGIARSTLYRKVDEYRILPSEYRG